MESRPHCPYCGRRHRSAKRAGQPCRTCERVIADADYNPSWDKGYVSKIACALMANFDTWVPHLSRMVGGTAKDVEVAVNLLRRHGFLIDGDRVRGYRLVGWTRWPQGEDG